MANSVYDPDKQADDNSTEPRTIHKNPAQPSKDAGSQEDLRNAEGSGESLFNPSGDQEDKGSSVGPAGLLGRESGGGTGSAGSFNFNPGKAAKTGSGGFKNFFLGSTKRRRATVGGGIFGGMLLGGGILTLFLVAGPAQLIQLDQTLQRNFSGTNQASSSRLGQLMTNARAQDIGETRLGVLGRQYFRGYRNALSEKGIDFHTNSFNQFGGQNAAEFDTEKLKHGSPELENMSRDQRAAWLEKNFDIPAHSLTYRGGGVFGVDASGWSDEQVSGFLRSTIGILGNGIISNSIANRQFSKYFDNPSMFHVFEYTKSNIIKKLLSGSDAKQAEQQEQQDEERVDVARLGEPADGNVTSLKDKAGSLNDFATSALTYTGGACFMKNTAGDIIAINRYRVVLPAAVTALRFIAIGEQIKSGQDISASQMGAAEQSLYNSQGQGVWQGMALQATSGDKNPSGTDIPTGYQQAFSANTTTNNIESVADKTLGGAAAASFLCGPIGSIAQGAISVFQIFGSAALEVFSDGTATPEVAASLSSKFAAAGASIGVDLAKMATQVEAIGFAQSFVIKNNTSGTLAKDAFSGPLGGNLLAYGAREAANMGAIAEGGIALSSSDSNTYAAAQQQQDEHQFRSESFFARVFNAGDERTLAGHLAASVSPSANQNVASIVGGFSHIGGGLLSSLSSLFVPRSHADNNYDWKFPQYGIPQNLLDDPDLADPYANADAVAKTLDAQCQNPDGSVNTSCNYISKANACFGAGIDKDSSGSWDVTTKGNYQTNDIDPNGTNYVNAGCGDTTDTHWKRIVMFIFDVRTAQASACYDGDNQSCTDIGYDQPNAPSPTTPTTAPGRFTNPFPDGWVPNRLDMGYDGTFKGQIVAPFDGTITYASDSFSNWGGWIEIKADQPPAGLPTSTLYFAEGVAPILSLQGKHVTAGTPIANAAPSPYGAYTGQSSGDGAIEWGIAQEGVVGSPTNTYVYGQCGSAAAKQAVLNFEQWAITNLGVAAHDTSLTDNNPGCP